MNRPRVRSGKVLAWGGFLLAASAVLGVTVAHGSRADLVDQLGLEWIPAHRASVGYVWLTRIGSPPVLLAGVSAVLALAIPRDRRRALASAVGPVLAVVAGDWIAKPIVDRQLVSRHLSYPSGTEVAVAAVATAMVLAATGRGRWYALTLAVAAGVAVGIGVVGLRWHYPTDVLGGMLLGSGCVLVVDASFHLPGPGRRQRELLGVEDPERCSPRPRVSRGPDHRGPERRGPFSGHQQRACGVRPSRSPLA